MLDESGRATDANLRVSIPVLNAAESATLPPGGGGDFSTLSGGGFTEPPEAEGEVDGEAEAEKPEAIAGEHEWTNTLSVGNVDHLLDIIRAEELAVPLKRW